MTSPYKTVTWNTEPISQAKLQQMADNDEWMFENSPRIRYAIDGITKDQGIKVLAGKSVYQTSPVSAVYVDVYFGSFFSANTYPVVTALLETSTGLGRKQISIVGFGGQVDYRGFRAAVYTEEIPTIDVPGWVHWTAVGY